MEHNITLPFKYLAALRLLTAGNKEALRPHLKGVALKDGSLMATEGNYAGAIDLKALDLPIDNLPEAIFPSETIDFFTKKIGRRNISDTQVEISWDSKSGNFQFKSKDTIENGRLIQKRKFPDVNSILLNRTKPEGFSQFPWHQIVLFEKVADLLCTTKSEIKALVFPKGYDAARVVLPRSPEFNGILMPFRKKAIAKLGYGSDEEEESLV